MIAALGALKGTHVDAACAILLQICLALVRINIDLVEVSGNMWQREQAMIHDPVPEPWYVRDQVNTEVPAWQRRQIVEVTQRLITPERVRVVIRMALQVKQNQVAVGVIAVPGVMGLAPFVATLVVFAAQKAIVFDVIRTRELPPGEDVVE